MNNDELSLILSTIKSTVQKKSSNFQKLISIDTTNKTQQDVGGLIVDKVLQKLKEMLIEKIGYIQLSEIASRLNDMNKKNFSLNLILDSAKIESDDRDKVESNTQLLQPIPILVLTNEQKNEILIVKKPDSAKKNMSPEKGKKLLYIDGHCRQEDAVDSPVFLDICKSSLIRETNEEIGIVVNFQENDKPVFIYDTSHAKNKQHIAVCFIKVVDPKKIKLKLQSDELIKSKGQSDSGKFKTLNEIQNELSQYEPWSRSILEHYF